MAMLSVYSITELLGTPPDEVIQTIGSENVK
jgi:hypothetical protein